MEAPWYSIPTKYKKDHEFHFIENNYSKLSDTYCSKYKCSICRTYFHIFRDGSCGFYHSLFIINKNYELDKLSCAEYIIKNIIE